MAIDLFCHPINSLPDFKFVYFRNLRVQKIKIKKIKKAMWLKRVTVFAGGDTSGQLICEIVRS